MPRLEYDTFESAVANSAAITTINDNQHIVLRRRDAAGNYSPIGTHTAEYITLPNLVATGLESMFGFAVSGELNSGSIGVQLSADAGTTWLYYNGAAWVAANPAVDAQWNTTAVIRTNIATFPFSNGDTRSVQVRLKLSPNSTGKSTPVVTDVWFHVEYNYDPIVDFYRSLKAFTEATRFDLYELMRADGSGATTIATDFVVDSTKPIAVYNVTDEPARKTNLFSAYNAGTKVVTLTAAQDADDLLRVEYQASAPVFIVADDLFYDSQVPAIEITITASNDVAMSGNRATEYNEDTKIARTRNGPRYLAINVSFSLIENDMERSLQMTKEVRRSLFDDPLVSKATAQVWHIGDVSPGMDRANLSSGIFGSAMNARVWIREDYEAYEETSLIQRLGIYVTDLNRSWYESVTES